MAAKELVAQRLEAQERPTLELAAVVEVIQSVVITAAPASSSSRSTNKDLWKPKSTDFSA
jgi:hypothetical protein